jgi:RNA polymerase sigma factor (TIGR02999 family)
MAGDNPADLLRRAQAGDEKSAAALLATTYDELRGMAERLMARERPAHTLTPTALVHEAAAKILGRDAGPLKDRAHVLGYAAIAMRRVLVDHARGRATQKRGGAEGGGRAQLHSGIALADDRGPEPLDVLALDEALTRLAGLHARQARVVEMRFFGGLTVEEAAAALGVSVPTVESDWRMARTWLHRELTRQGTA